jgi:hypothetical protein
VRRGITERERARKRKDSRYVAALGALSLSWACGGIAESSPREARAQAVTIEDEFTCPTGLVPAYRSGNVGICTDGSTSIEQIPPSVCTEAGLPSCAALEPVSPTTPEEEPADGTGLEGANCEGFDPESSVTSPSDADCGKYPPEECPEGTHVFYNAAAACALCEADTERNRTCRWAEACFEPFIESMAYGSGAKYCEDDEDCFGWRVSAGCGPSLDISLAGYIDEDVLSMAELYAEQNCSLCAASTGYSDSSNKSEMTPRCVDAQCVFD